MGDQSYNGSRKCVNDLDDMEQEQDKADNQQLSKAQDEYEKELLSKTAPNFATQCLGAFFAFVGQLIVSLNTLAVKLNPKINVSWFLIWQGLSLFIIQFALCSILHGDKNGAKSLRKNWLGIIIKLVVIFVALPVLFRLIPEMPFGDISVILTCGPCLLVSICAYFFFGESLTKIQWGLIFLSSIGVLGIIRPAFIFGSTAQDVLYKHRVLATVVCVVLAVLITAQVLAVRKIGLSMNVYFLNTFVGLSIFSSGVVYQFTLSPNYLYDDFFCDHRIAVPVLVVLSSILASAIAPLETLALQRTKAAVYASITTSKVILDYIMQFIFFPSEKLFWSTIVGAILVTITAFDLSLNLDDRLMKWYDERQQQKEIDSLDEDDGKKRTESNLAAAADESAC